MSFSVPVNLIIIFSFIIFVFYLLGIHNLLTKVDENVCEMTYMFEYPQYVEISLPQNVQQSYSRYALYGYAEGGHTEQLRKMRFNGIPVLFVPGSSGSHKQGRSLASISLRKWLNSRNVFHFDYFMVDFNEEQSAFYGSVLEEETKFVKHCIQKILSLYRQDERFKSFQPTSVILIGHSYGGLVTKGLFTLPDFNPQLVNLIISLASPHKHALIQPDSYIANYYKNLEKTWANSSKVNHVTLVSIGGGNRDLIVRSDLTADPTGEVNVLTTAIPSAWCANDHYSILWCKEFLKTIVRALFDCVDLTTKQISNDQKYRTAVFHYHLIKRNAGKRYSSSNFGRFTAFDRGGNWVENLQRQFSVVESRSLKTNHYVMIRLLLDPKHEIGYIETYNLNVRDWIFVCSADIIYNSVRMCENGENISNLTEIAPISHLQKLRRKFVYLNLFELKNKGFTHVIVKLPPADSFVQVNVDVHSTADRNLTFQVPKIYTMSRSTVIETTQDNAIYYNVKLAGFESIWQAFILNVEILSCKAATSHAVFSLIEPWAHEDHHFFSVNRSSISPYLRLTTPRPLNWTRTDYPILRLNLDPSCKYRLSIQSSLIGSASQVARYYTPMLPAYIAAVLLLTLRQQMLHLEESECVLFHTALAAAVKRYYYILQATIIGSKILELSIFLAILPVPDFFTLQKLNLDFFVLTILLYGIAIVIVYSLGIVCYVAIVVSGQAAHKMALRFIAKTITGILSWSEWVFSALHQVPFIMAAFLVSLAWSTAGGLALWVGAAFYFLKLCKMYEDYLEDLFKYSIKFVAKKLKTVAKSKTSPTKEEPEKPKELENQTQPLPKEQAEKDEDDKTSESKEEESNKVEEKPAENQIETKSEEKPKEVGGLSAIHFHVTVFLLWLLTAIIHAPTVLVWAKNYPYSVILEKDPAIVPSLIFSCCGAILWQPGVPHSNKRLSQLTSCLLFFFAAISIIYSSVSLYRLGHILSGAALLLTINQLISKAN